jgi:hypothetical protein
MHYIILSAVFLVAFTLTSCATYLNSGQIGYDSVAPIPLDCLSEAPNATAIFAGGSYARGSAYEDDNNVFAQAGLSHAWRTKGGRKSTFDGNMAMSGWYGRASLKDHGSEDNPQYPLSVSEPFAFYGASLQGNAAIGIKAGDNSVFDIGGRMGAAYESGSYSNFRADADRLTSYYDDSDIVDCCKSGWSGNIGAEFAYTHSFDEEAHLRLGIVAGYLLSDVGFKTEDAALYPFVQPSLGLRFRRIFCSMALNTTIMLNWGLSCAVGFVFY